jgi:hypothetical protein
MLLFYSGANTGSPRLQFAVVCVAGLRTWRSRSLVDTPFFTIFSVALGFGLLGHLERIVERLGLENFPSPRASVQAS